MFSDNFQSMVAKDTLEEFIPRIWCLAPSFKHWFEERLPRPTISNACREKPSFLLSDADSGSSSHNADICSKDMKHPQRSSQKRWLSDYKFTQTGHFLASTDLRSDVWVPSPSWKFPNKRRCNLVEVIGGLVHMTYIFVLINVARLNRTGKRKRLEKN